jgi:hypothetical protein
MNIRFPEGRDQELVTAMKTAARPPWRWHPMDREPEYIVFHRDKVGPDPPCTLWIHRSAPGNFVVVNIIPDPDTALYLEVDQHVRVLRDFDSSIAEAAAEAVGGMTSIDTDRRGLEDYFSAEAIGLLEGFCTGSNAASLGSHPSDQIRWMRFVLHVHRKSAEPVDSDTFGHCLRDKGWWPEEGIEKLMEEYEFGLGLLQLADAQAGSGGG